jgi:hypothetical protein
MPFHTLNDFLHFGYIPKLDTLFLEHLVTAKLSALPANDGDLVRQGGTRWKQAVNKLAKSHSPSAIHVVPLSGGLDSRALLGALLECTDRSQIRTATFGIPGSWDFEISRKVAEDVGVRHDAIDLTPAAFDWTTENLVAFARRRDAPAWIFDRYVNDLMVRRYPASAIFWSGFMGDPAAGSHLSKAPSTDWQSAVSRFCIHNSFQNSVRLTSPTYSPHLKVVPSPLQPQEYLSFDEQLDFAIRQTSYVRPVVLPPGAHWETPFLESEWLGFILNAPSNLRLEQTLYKSLLLHAYPHLFSLPTKIHQGLGLNATRPRRTLHSLLLRFQNTLVGSNNPVSLRHKAMNYFNFDEAMREPNGFARLCRENLSDLKRRAICDWVDVDQLWTTHRNRMGDFGRAISLLVSLEISLKAGANLGCE